MFDSLWAGWIRLRNQDRTLRKLLQQQRLVAMFSRQTPIFHAAKLAWSDYTEFCILRVAEGEDRECGIAQQPRSFQPETKSNCFELCWRQLGEPGWPPLRNVSASGRTALLQMAFCREQK